jgi:CubicO group peptidase (beta-lactamase class C family)
VKIAYQLRLLDSRRLKEARLAGSVAGGLISNSRDLAAFGCLLLHEGELDGIRILAALTVRMMTTCQYPLPGRPNYPRRGLLWWIKATPDTPEMGHLVPYGTYCHGGAAHSVLVIMPVLDIVAVMIRNRLDDPLGFIYNQDYPVLWPWWLTPLINYKAVVLCTYFGGIHHFSTSGYSDVELV